MNYSSLVFGCDVGRFNDRTALIGVRRSAVNDYILLSDMLIISSSPLPMQAKIIKYRAGENPIYLDVTGLGIGLADLLPSRVTPVSIIAGTGLGRSRAGPVPAWRVGKARLMHGLSSQLRRLKISSSIPKHYQDELKSELSNFRVTPGRVEKYGAKSGQHDDLVLALSLALFGSGIDDSKRQEKRRSG